MFHFRVHGRSALSLACHAAGLSVVLLAGCSSTSGADGGGAAGGGAASGNGGSGSGAGGGAGVAGGPGAPSGFTVTFDPVTVAPGEEHTQCIVKRVPNSQAMHVNQIENVLGVGSHHLIVYRTADTEEQTVPFACQPFSNLLNPKKGVPLMITQKHDETLQLPTGIGFSFDAGQMVRLEMHYINTTAAPLDVGASSTFFAMAEGDFEDAADFLFFANTAVHLPPNTATTLGPLFLQVPDALDGVKFFGFTGHEHKLGTGVTVASSSAKDGADTSVYAPKTFQWNEPPTVYKDPPIEVPPGGGFRFSCSWQNASDGTVSFGESANDEMCVFWTYYYPSKGAMACAHTDMIDGGYDFCCPGDPICAQLQ